MFGVKLTSDRKQILSEQKIDAEQPGTILRDFETVLNFVSTEEVPACGKYNLLPINAIPVLDERLSKPLRLTLKRPQLRSHPYLQALHLLLRATGLTNIGGAGDKARLRVNLPIAEQWNRLNPTEQFFTLMEAGFVHGDGEMIGEPRRGFATPFFDLLGEWRSLPADGIRFDLKFPEHVKFLYGKFYVAALADLFGLLRLDFPSKSVIPWRPQSVHRTPFGDAFFSLMSNQEYDLFTNYGESRPFGIWQPIVQPYFPEWRENLTVPEQPVREGVFVFKVSLPNMWRQIAIPDQLTLDNLAAAILASVDFDSDHLYDFSFRDHFGKRMTINHPFSDEGPFTVDFKIGQLPLEIGQSMTFTFDYGDNWQFKVKLEKIDPPSAKMKKARVLGKKGTAPQQYRDWD